MQRFNEQNKNAAIEGRLRNRGADKPRADVEDPQVWFGLDEEGHRVAREVRDLAKAIRRRDFAGAELCLDAIARDNSAFAEQVSMGRMGA